MKTWKELEARLQAGRYTLVLAREAAEEDAPDVVEDALEGLSAEDVARHECTVQPWGLPGDWYVMKMTVINGTPAGYIYGEEEDAGRADLLPEDCDGFEDGHFPGLPVGWFPLEVEA